MKSETKLRASTPWPGSTPGPGEWTVFAGPQPPEDRAYAAELAPAGRSLRRFGKKIFFRGIIEFTKHLPQRLPLLRPAAGQPGRLARYRLTQEEILSCCEAGYALDFRTFVLQGGEDGYWTDDADGRPGRGHPGRFPDCAITLSIGERSGASYQCLFDAGADRYLLRHETAARPTTG